MENGRPKVAVSTATTARADVPGRDAAQEVWDTHTMKSPMGRAKRPEPNQRGAGVKELRRGRRGCPDWTSSLVPQLRRGRRGAEGECFAEGETAGGCGALWQQWQEGGLILHATVSEPG